jgi:hypothetical protein
VLTRYTPPSCGDQGTFTLNATLLGGAIAAACALIVATPSPALAHATPWNGTETNASGACSSSSASQPFLPWHDFGHYEFAPNGGFEDGLAGWQITGDAEVVPDNEPWFVHAGTDSNALLLEAGSSATTPAVCIGDHYPYGRMFVKAPLGARVIVELLWIDRYGETAVRSLATIKGSPFWRLSPRFAFPSSMISSASDLGETSNDGRRFTAVSFRFTAERSAVVIDDLYVDPFKRG